MKCPYRKKTTIYGTETQEYYMDCVGEECPFYAPKGSFNANKAFAREQNQSFRELDGVIFDKGE